MHCSLTGPAPPQLRERLLYEMLLAASRSPVASAANPAAGPEWRVSASLIRCPPVIALHDFFSSLIRRSRAPLSAGRALGLVALIALPSFAAAQAPKRGPAAASARTAANQQGEVLLDTDSNEAAALAARQEQLSWTRNPGAFEQELRRRVANPLFPAERQRVRPAELKAARIRDASDARSVLSDFVDLSLDRRKLVRAKTIEEIEGTLARYQALLRAVMGVGGEVASLVTPLAASRASLIEQWRVSHEDHPEILAGLDSLVELDAQAAPATRSEFAAQLVRENGPIVAGERAAALLSEPPDTLELALASFSPQQRIEIRNAALGLIQKAQSLGIKIEDEEAKVELLSVDD